MQSQSRWARTIEKSIVRTLKYRILAMIAVILVIGALGLLVRRFGSMVWILDNEMRMRQFVQHHPWKGWLLGLAIYTIFSLVPGTAGKSVVFGWLFGFLPAVLLVDIGLTIAAIGGFIGARFIVRDLVVARFGETLAKLDCGLARDGWFYLLQMRMAHLPFSFVNYGAGATSVTFATFCWTTAMGILPGTMIFVFVGTRIPTLAELAANGVWPLFDPILFALLASTVLIPVLIRSAIRRFYNRRCTGSTPPELDLSQIESFDGWPNGRQTDGAT